ncbi:MAG: hypothetical protein QF687_06265 [Nitrospinaceae bacterium]|nr:hypothetical protein [Nitrospinaceae bacterium]
MPKKSTDYAEVFIPPYPADTHLTWTTQRFMATQKKNISVFGRAFRFY